MARRSSRSPKKTTGRGRKSRARPVVDLLSRQRVTVGALTAFAVAFSYVAANALWYQPHAHGGAFFATRAPQAAMPQAEETARTAEVETLIRLEQEQPVEFEQEAPVPPARPSTMARQEAVPPVAAPPAGQDVVRRVQALLAELRLYEGEVDGLDGPQTRGAVDAYQARVGLERTGRIDEALLAELGIATQVAARPAPTDAMTTASAAPPPADTGGADIVTRVQAGLKAFGNDGIALDGRVDDATRSALKEFQSLFGLDQTGEPDREVFAKMREIGLIE